MRDTQQTNKKRETPGTPRFNTNWGQRIDRLGYSLFSGSIDSFGRKWKYRTFPHRSGPVGQFSSLAELAKWVRSVEKMRSIDAVVRYNEHLLAQQSRGVA